jgi:hypothetical protein
MPKVCELRPGFLSIRTVLEFFISLPFKFSKLAATVVQIMFSGKAFSGRRRSNGAALKR